MGMLVDVLTPMGEYRNRQVTASRGKRAKRKAKRTKRKAGVDSTRIPDESLSSPVENTPEVSKHVTIGFNSTMRYLESLAHKSASMAPKPPAEFSRNTLSKPGSAQFTKTSRGSVIPEPLAVVFIPQSDQSSELFAHLPLLLRVGSPCKPAPSATRLVLLPRAAEAKLSTALQIPRVGIIGLTQGALVASELLETVRTRITPVEIPWVEQAVAETYLALIIEQTSKVRSHQLKKESLPGDADVKDYWRFAGSIEGQSRTLLPEP